MKLKETKPKYEQLRIFMDKENFGMFEVPQIMKYGFALTMYAERKVILMEDFDDEKVTEIVIENEDQFRKRKKFDN